jgi:hypothetical protein
VTGPTLDPGPILAALDRHHVAYVLIGGFAAQQHGARRPTEDIDITPSVDPDNLARLAAALRELEARIRVSEPPEGLPFDTSAEALRGVSMLNLRCRHGDFDISVTPAGTDGYPDLIRSAEARTVDGITIQLASLADIIRSKTAAGRPKDALALPELQRLANPSPAPRRATREIEPDTPTARYEPPGLEP